MFDDLKKYIKKLNRKQNQGPVKTACTYKGPAVKPSTICTYYIKRTIPLVIVLGSQYKQDGPAVNECDKPANSNNKNNTAD